MKHGGGVGIGTLAVLGIGGYFLLKSGILSGGHTSPTGLVSTVQNANGTKTQTFADGSTRTLDATGKVLATTPATRASTTTSPQATTIQNALIAAGVSLAGAVLAAGIKALGNPAPSTLTAAVTTRLSDAQIATLRDRGLTSETLATFTPLQKDALTQLVTGTVKPIISQVVDVAFADSLTTYAAALDVATGTVPTPTPAPDIEPVITAIETPGGDVIPFPEGGGGTVVGGGGDVVGLPGGEIPQVITPDQIAAMAAIPDSQVASWTADGSIVLEDGRIILTNGVVLEVPPGTSVTGFAEIDLSTFDADQLLNFTADSMGTTPASIAASLGTTVQDLTGMTVTELIGVLSTVAAVAGIAITLATGDTHSPAGQSSMAASLAASVGGLIGSLAVVGPWGALVALPLIIGNIFGRNDMGGADLDIVAHAMEASGYIATLSNGFWDVYNHAYSLPDFTAALGLSGAALDSAMSSGYTFMAALGAHLGVPETAWKYFDPIGLMVNGVSAWDTVVAHYRAAVQQAAVETAAQLAAQTLIAQQLASGYTLDYLRWIQWQATLSTSPATNPADPILQQQYAAWSGTSPLVADVGVTLPPNTVIQQYYQDEAGNLIPMIQEQPGITVIDAPNLHLLPDGRWVDYDTYVAWVTAYNLEFTNTGG